MGFGNEEAVLFALVFLIGVLFIAIYFLRNLRDLLRECAPQNRKVSPGNVWLMFIPLFNVVYGFILYPKISETLKREFEYRNSPQDGDYLRGLGIAMPILNVVGIVPVEFLKGIAGIGGLIVFIIYWVQSANMKNKLRALPKGEGQAGFSNNPDLLD